MTNREIAIELNRAVVTELGIAPPAHGADMMWQEWVKRTESAINEAERRGELRMLEYVCASADVASRARHMLAELRAEKETRR